MNPLGWIGARARYVLILGCALAVFLPAASAALRPYLPVLVALVYAVSMTRIDLPAVARAFFRPRRAARILAFSAALLTVLPVLVWLPARALGPDYEAAVVYTLASPPIASAASLCFLLGLNAALALEVTVACSVLMPILGPAIAALLLGDAVPIDPFVLALRLAAIIVAGAGAALVARRLLGPARIARNGAAFDGLAALAMLVFVIPLFDGVGAMVLERPGLAAVFLALSVAIVLGPHLALRAHSSAADGGALAITGGTRSVAIYLAALPDSPAFTLFVALYQFPMFGTPLLLRRFYGPGGARKRREKTT